MTLVWKSVGIWDGIVNPIYGGGVKMTLYIKLSIIKKLSINQVKPRA